MSAEPVAVLRSLAGQLVPLRGVSLAGIAEGCLFELAVEQRYANGEGETIEAVYTFPLPLQAVLLSFELQIGDRRLAGVVQEKRAASEQYEQTIETGDSAALLEQARDGLYTVSLGNLKSGEEATIRYRYAQLMDFEQGRIRIAIPTAVAPRYGDAGKALEVHQTPSVDLGVHYPCSLTLTLRGDLARAQVHSPTHQIAATSAASELKLATRVGFALDRDFVLLVEGLSAPAQGVIAHDGDGYVALASVTAPAATEVGGTARAIKLIVDCSGSMAGDSIRQARDALLGVLAALTPTDSVSLTRFGSKWEHATDGLRRASPELLLGLNQKVRAIDADLGGTEMGAAIQAALALPVHPGVRADILLITDGEIWAIDALVQGLARAQHRLFVIAVGSSPAEELARKIAGVTGGACEFVTPGEDMRGAVARHLTRLGSPVQAVGTIEWPEQPEWSIGTGRAVFPGDTVHVLAGFRELPHGVVTATITGGKESHPLSCALPTAAVTEDTLSRVAAQRRLAPMEPAEATALAVHYQLVSEFTSCVVVLERAAGEKADGHPALRAVPHMLAAGWGGSGLLDYASLDRPATGLMRKGATPRAPAAPPQWYKQATGDSRTPHVCFKAERASGPISGVELAKILAAGLHSRFGPIRMKKWWFISQWIAVLRAGEVSFSLLLGRSKYKEHEWVLLVGPLDRGDGDLRRLLDRALELTLICREIHMTLTGTPGVSDVQWYFKGSQSQSHSVATPDELLGWVRNDSLPPFLRHRGDRRIESE
jgi:Ca-activated chloride channel family protein